MSFLDILGLRNAENMLETPCIAFIPDIFMLPIMWS